MKRDLELIRKILLLAENLPSGEISGIRSDDHIENEVAEHIALLKEPGFLDAVIRTDEKGIEVSMVVIFRLLEEASKKYMALE